MTAPRILRLPSHVIDRIAAGEVIERPASVVKELLENALDAGARRVEVRIEGGGLTRIEVSDDGNGMSPEDARMCVERHATSKLRSADDLYSLDTLGFRGEALSSIASVSKFQLTTRTRDAEAAFRLELQGGTHLGASAVGAPAGTCIEVSDLFFNTPARRKFMRAAATEQAHVLNATLRVVLGTPFAGVSVLASGRKILDIPSDMAPEERVLAALGKRVERVHAFEHSADGVGVTGFVTAPGCDRRDTKGIWVFVNGRFVRDRTLQRAIMEAYQGLLDRGRYPTVLVHVGLDPEAVDVNVHPQKLEVRFGDGRPVYRAVSAGLARVLATAPWGHTPERQRVPTLRRDSSSMSARAWYDRAVAAKQEAPDWGAARDGNSAGAPLSDGAPAANATAPEGGHSTEGPWGHGPFSRLRVVARLEQFLIAQDVAQGADQGKAALVVVDAIAAVRALARSSLSQQAEGERVASHMLMLPEVVELDDNACATLVRRADRIEGAGFVIEEVGPRRHAIRGIPNVLREASPRHLALAFLGAVGSDDAGAWISACVACIGKEARQAWAGDAAGRLLLELDGLPEDRTRNFAHRMDAKALGALIARSTGV